MIKYYASWSFKTDVLHSVMKTPFISSLLNYVVYLAFIHHRASYITTIYLLSVLLMLWHFGGLTDLRNWPSWGLANVKQSQGFNRRHVFHMKNYHWHHYQLFPLPSIFTKSGTDNQPHVSKPTSLLFKLINSKLLTLPSLAFLQNTTKSFWLKFCPCCIMKANPGNSFIALSGILLTLLWDLWVQ